MMPVLTESGVMQAKLWGGRFEKPVTQTVTKLSESVSYDNRLYKHDLCGSRAQATMLGKQLDRDEGPLRGCRVRSNFSSPGFGALTWTGLPIDWHMTTEALGFTAALRNRHTCARHPHAALQSPQEGTAASSANHSGHQQLSPSLQPHTACWGATASFLRQGGAITGGDHGRRSSSGAQVVNAASQLAASNGALLTRAPHKSTSRQGGAGSEEARGTIAVGPASQEAELDEMCAQGPACVVPETEAEGGHDHVWAQIREEARMDSEAEPALASFLYSTILSHGTLEKALAFHLANKLASSTMLSTQLFNLIADTVMEDMGIREAIRADVQAVFTRDPACVSLSHCLLNYKGFLACQAHRVAHRLWHQGRKYLALAIQSRVSEVFHVDFHPAATMGKGVLFDHATGVVVGETAVIGDNVSILHGVTLGGSGICCGPRHPRIGDGVLIGAGATLLGPVVVGECAKIGAGSVVLSDVPPHCTAVGNPARLLGGKETPTQVKDIPGETMDHTSFIDEWSGYMI